MSDKNLKRQCAELVSHVENLFGGIYDVISAQYVASEKIKCLNNFTDTVREKLKVIMEYWLVVADQEIEDDDCFKIMNEAFDFEVKIKLELKLVENFAKKNVRATKSFTSSNVVSMAESKAENLKIYDTELPIPFTGNFENYTTESLVTFTSSSIEKTDNLLFEKSLENVKSNEKLIGARDLKDLKVVDTEKVHTTFENVLQNENEEKNFTGSVLIRDHHHGNHTNFIETKNFETMFGEQKELLIEKNENKEVIFYRLGFENLENICTNHVASLYKYKNNNLIENRSCSENDEKIIYVIDDKG